MSTPFRADKELIVVPTLGVGSVERVVVRMALHSGATMALSSAFRSAHLVLD